MGRMGDFLALWIQRITLLKEHCFLFCWLLLTRINSFDTVVYDSSCAPKHLFWNMKRFWEKLRDRWIFLVNFRSLKNVHILVSIPLFIFWSLYLLFIFCGKVITIFSGPCIDIIIHNIFGKDVIKNVFRHKAFE